MQQPNSSAVQLNTTNQNAGYINNAAQHGTNEPSTSATYINVAQVNAASSSSVLTYVNMTQLQTGRQQNAAQRQTENGEQNRDIVYADVVALKKKSKRERASANDNGSKISTNRLKQPDLVESLNGGRRTNANDNTGNIDLLLSAERPRHYKFSRNARQRNENPLTFNNNSSNDDNNQPLDTMADNEVQQPSSLLSSMMQEYL